MIVVGIDPHKKTHTAVAVEARTGQVLAETTVACDEKGRARLLFWARRLDAERTFAIEDCRHVSSRLERFLLGRGERVVRVPPKLMAGARRSARVRGKSDPIDASAVATAALREPSLPEAHLSGLEREVRLLLDHRDDLVAERTRIQNRLRWHLHDLDVPLQIPPGSLDRACWLTRLEPALKSLAPGAQTRIALEQIERCRELTRAIDSLAREIATAMDAIAPELLTIKGCGALTAARIFGETGGVRRFGGEAKFAMHVGAAPLPVSSGQTQRHRLNRQGNRQLNAALHRIAVTQMRVHPPAQQFIERKRSEGMSTREALRCLKRHLARAVFRALSRMAHEDAGHVLPVRFDCEPALVAVAV